MKFRIFNYNEFYSVACLYNGRNPDGEMIWNDADSDPYGKRNGIESEYIQYNVFPYDVHQQIIKDIGVIPADTDIGIQYLTKENTWLFMELTNIENVIKSIENLINEV